MKKWEYFSKEQLAEFVRTSTSINQVSMRVGYSDKSGSGQAAIKEMIEEYQFDTSHFLDLNGSSEMKNKFDYDRFKDGSAIKAANAKDAIIFLRGHQCECCKNTEWLGKKIPLEIHHIDGNNMNNTIENLQLLCPNCHAQTDNYRNKNTTQQEKREEISEKKFKEALENSPNIRQALIKLGLAPKGGNYTRANEIIAKYSIKFK